ncbi:DUF3326 domain-containing protein [Trichothermofontia sichuanensis B231]|uniref:DUF3326 domain-containing protein n=1 Tax=Trichothermofontia sichuanensis TaxID=3045816 RepID=UPI0022462B72|nr:DUF3326 domain-containing protein [Trichothermofontia sichuanensis]UZQ54990.1 DUF3326 domain-containing protein [Trichothermofontia sichuanensis B231]
MNPQSVCTPYTVLLLVPTGIGATIGGYAGDALPVARAIAATVDCLITHPNVLNGAHLYWPLPNVLYVEGYGLDQVAAGYWGLRLVPGNRIGLLLDAAIESDLRLRHLQAADAARATLGLDLTDYIVTDAPLGVTLCTATSGATWGTIANPDSLLRAADTLIHQAGATAIAVVARFPDDEGSAALQNYRHGQGVDPLGGAEAVISHLVVRQFRLPCAHAPALRPLPLEPNLAPRAAAEELGYTFLPCVLAGLSRAPQFVTPSQRTPNRVGLAGEIWADQIHAAIVPGNACGSRALMSLSDRGTRIITVAENQTTMQVTAAALGIPAIAVNSYLEAIGVLACDRAGINPLALRPYLDPIEPVSAPLP